MPVLAIAFHHDSALERLYEYFTDPQAQHCASTLSGECSKCGLVFAIVLTQKFDPRNDGSIFTLCELITKDCQAGLHENEYILDM